ncbi:MAG: hypothetical protein JNL84_00490 [Candidatus Accumulibacter sp.]|nr:hypothetical protein [Accumulibacter sp.]
MREIRSHWGEPTLPPPIAPARGPPLWEMADAEQGEFDPPAQPAPDDPFDQRIAWQRPHEDDPILIQQRLAHSRKRLVHRNLRFGENYFKVFHDP